MVFLSNLKTILISIAKRLRVKRDPADLHSMSERDLRDIGLSRYDLEINLDREGGFRHGDPWP